MAINWKRVVPTSYSEALRLCKEFARHKQNLSVERIADDMGITADLLYKWLANGSMPLNRIRIYQKTCGCNYVSLYLAHSDGCLLVPIPTGKKITDHDMMEMNQSFHSAMSLLANFYKGQADATETLAALNHHMTATAWHSRNLEKHQAPELDFEEEQ